MTQWLPQRLQNNYKTVPNTYPEALPEKAPADVKKGAPGTLQTSVSLDTVITLQL